MSEVSEASRHLGRQLEVATPLERAQDFEDLLADACTDDQTEQFYQWCYQDTDPVVACFGSYYDPGGSGLDCDGAIANCL